MPSPIQEQHQHFLRYSKCPGKRKETADLSSFEAKKMTMKMKNEDYQYDVDAHSRGMN